MFISFLYMFRTTMCPSSGETNVSMRHLVLAILYGWLSGMQEHMLLHTRQSSIQNSKYQVSHRYICFSWWRAHSRPKHVKKRNKHNKKNCAPILLYSQNFYSFENICCYALMKYLSYRINFYVIQNFVTRYVVTRSYLFHYIEIE